MDVASLVLSVILGGGGVVGAIYNWWTFRQQSTRQNMADFFDSYERQAASADRRGDKVEADRLRREYEQQHEAYRAQQKVKRLARPDRIELP